jgi:hypothetical protein
MTCNLRLDLAIPPFSGEAIFVEFARSNVDPLPGTHKPFLVAKPQGHFGGIGTCSLVYPFQIDWAFNEGSGATLGWAKTDPVLVNFGPPVSL